MGVITRYKKMNYIQSAEITSNITFMLNTIAKYYFAKEIFKIDNYLIEQNRKDIRQYFDSGIFRGKKVFEETYEQFCERQESEWIENGNYI